MQKKQKNFQLAIIGVLSFAVLAMSVGFAAYSSTLNIAGNTVNVASSKWDVHFASAQVTQESTATGEIVSASGTSVTFNANLAKPGDKFIFIAKAKNYGTFNANLNAVKFGGLTSEQKNYLKLSAEVVPESGDIYTADRQGLQHTLPVNQELDIKVTLEYFAPADHTQLPQALTAVNPTVDLDFGQI